MTGSKDRSEEKKSSSPFDPDDQACVRHTKLGIWDLYQEITPRNSNVRVLDFAWLKVEQYAGFLEGLPYLARLFRDISLIPGILPLLSLYLVALIVSTLSPAWSVWYKGQMLRIIDASTQSRTLDSQQIRRTCIGQFLVFSVMQISWTVRYRLAGKLEKRVTAHYAAHILHAQARLDVPTFNDPSMFHLHFMSCPSLNTIQVIQRQLESVTSGDVNAWSLLNAFIGIISTTVQLISEFAVLASVLRNERDGRMLAFLTSLGAIHRAVGWASWSHISGFWAATCRNEDFIRLQGYKQAISDQSHRKEIVANNLVEYFVAKFTEAQTSLGHNAEHFWSTYMDRHWMNNGFFAYISEPFRFFPQIFFALRAIQYPESIPASLVSLNLIDATVYNFSDTLYNVIRETGSLQEQLTAVRQLYEIAKVPNRVQDGTVPFPENSQDLRRGLSLEFRNVSFQYPQSHQYAVRNISFKIHQGQLCVIVGSNGSGKSTVLKLVCRIYDPTEGEILLNGQDIRTLKLEDLRNAMSILFQDYTHFPLSIRENIALGDPKRALDVERVRQAADFGGATEFVEKLTDRFDTYLNRPLRDEYSTLPEGTTKLFGRKVKFGNMKWQSADSELSGGQMQRLAVARSFMRSLDDDDIRVGLLLFDEPSASLDPEAEHDLFERLRKLRGCKTMLFSSHRFGNLTKHADVIVYMKDATVLEVGTHNELLTQNGNYARIYGLQAKAFDD